MATLYIKYAKKCGKMFFFQIINGHGLLYKYYGWNSVGIDIIKGF